MMKKFDEVYGDPYCPVVLGLTKKHDNFCESCEEEITDPNPIDLVKAYCDKRATMSRDVSKGLAFIAVLELINKIHGDKQGVIERAKVEGWWPPK